MTTTAYKNSERISPDLLRDRGFVYADGCFETMRVRAGCIPLQSLHIERALASAARLKLPLVASTIEQCIDHCLANSTHETKKDAVYKLIVTRGEGGRAGYPPAQCECNLYTVILPRSKPVDAAVSLRLVEDTLPVSSHFAGLKLINRLDYSVAAQGLHLQASEEALFINDRRELVETMHHNLFFLSGNTLCTPALDGFGVKGVMRGLVISTFAVQLGLNVSEGNYSLAQLKEADAVFLTNAVDGIVPVSRFEEKEWPANEMLNALRQLAEDAFQP